VWLGLVVLRRRSRRPPVQSVRSRSQSLRPHGRTAGESRGWGARGERLRSPRPRPGTTE
jgi:hypothetical protein